MSCNFFKKETDMDKLSHRWVVRKASIYVQNINDYSDSLRYVIMARVKEMECAYNGQSYDLRSDSTFSANGKVLNMSGKWHYRKGIGYFTGAHNYTDFWDFHANHIRIGMDSAIDIKINLDSQGTFVELYMKPAPGQSIRIE